jgi:hypothetical protein
VLTTFNTASVDLLNTSYAGSWSLQSYFARANYTYDDKYSLTTSVRTDGSSRIALLTDGGHLKHFQLGGIYQMKVSWMMLIL